MTEQSDAERWDARWAAADGPVGPPSGLLLALEDRLPASGRALDVAAGRGRQSRWLAGRGLAVTAIDVSQAGLDRLSEAARGGDTLAVETLAVDLTRMPPPSGPWDLITCVDYLQPELFAVLAASLAPGGWLVFSQATVINLERHRRPSRRFLVDPDRVAGFAAGLELVHCDAEWRASGRHEAWLAARRR